MTNQTSWDKYKSTNLSHLPKSLVDEIAAISIVQFKELYEIPTSPITLPRACTRILNQLSYDQIRFMCFNLSKAVLPTLDKITINLTEFQEKISYGNQAIDKALLVLLELQKINSGLLNLPELKESALEILDLIFEGYAIFPGSEMRRQLFDWWLLDVVPASYMLTAPKKLYTIHGLIDFEKSITM